MDNAKTKYEAARKQALAMVAEIEAGIKADEFNGNWSSVADMQQHVADVSELADRFCGRGEFAEDAK